MCLTWCNCLARAAVCTVLQALWCFSYLGLTFSSRGQQYLIAFLVLFTLSSKDSSVYSVKLVLSKTNFSILYIISYQLYLHNQHFLARAEVFQPNYPLHTSTITVLQEQRCSSEYKYVIYIMSCWDVSCICLGWGCISFFRDTFGVCCCHHLCWAKF